MKNKHPWQFISKRTLIERPYVTVEGWTMQTHRGEEREFDVGVFGDAVIVFGITDGGQVLLIRQYMVSAQDYRSALVAGYCEPDRETIEQTAIRELREETGCVVDNVQIIGSTMRNKWETGYDHFCLATGVRQVEEPSLEENEDIEVFFVSVDELLQIMKDNTLHDVGSVACAMRALHHLKLI